MKPPLAIISPFFPPTRGGLADHTDLLAKTLQTENDVVVITSPGGTTDRPFPVRTDVSDWQDASGLAAAIERAAPQGELLWQYVPHMYGRGGANAQLPRAMAGLKQRGRRQMLIAHEIAAPYSIFPQRFYYAWSHRRQWRAIVPSMDFVGVSTEAWLAPWSASWPGQRDKFQLIPSPSSLPIASVPDHHRAAWRTKHGLAMDAQVILYFGTITAGKQFPWVLNAWQRAASGSKPVALAVIGDHRKPEIAASGRNFIPLGYLPPDEVSAALQAGDLLALPFIDGVSERRTSAMAGLQHGCAVVTTFGPNTGTTLRSATFMRTTAADDETAFSDAVMEVLRDDAMRAELGKAGRREYEARYSWKTVGTKLNSILEMARR